MVFPRDAVCAVTRAACRAAALGDDIALDLVGAGVDRPGLREQEAVQPVAKRARRLAGRRDFGAARQGATLELAQHAEEVVRVGQSAPVRAQPGGIVRDVGFVRFGQRLGNDRRAGGRGKPCDEGIPGGAVGMFGAVHLVHGLAAHVEELDAPAAVLGHGVEVLPAREEHAQVDVRP
ncbi:hypothetical protein AWV80_01620 [Cupriavidus sp. UYMU48A]|nr:hypothetical protein AWV80_01620 [Cupriavidus sp. UYMU48A]